MNRGENYMPFCSVTNIRILAGCRTLGSATWCGNGPESGMGVCDQVGKSGLVSQEDKETFTAV